MILALNLLGFLALVLCVGGMVFFAIVVAPLVFINLDEGNAGKLIRAIFPWYYLYVIVTATIAAGVYTFELPYASAGFGLASLSALYSRQILINKINIARDAMLADSESAGHEFDRLHKLSVRLNALGLLAVISATIYVGVQS